MRTPLVRQIAVWLALGVAVTAGVGALLWWGLGAPALTGSDALRPQEKFDLVKIALAITGGIGGVVFLVIAYRKQHLGEAAELRENTKLLSERFVAATELLSHEEAAARLAGAYAMEALADDWKARRQTCINVLCAYIRMHYHHEPPDDLDGRRRWHGERQVRHTVIRIITAHLRAGAPVSWQGYDFDFTGAVFDGGDFTRAVFSGGTVSFRNAEFAGGRVDFADAVFSGGTAEFGEAKFSGGTVVFRGTRFSGGTVGFGRAHFSGGRLDLYCAKFSDGAVHFHLAQFSGSVLDFAGADFSGSAVTFIDATFSGGTMDFVGAHFRGGAVSFHTAIFSGGTVDVSRPSAREKPPLFDPVVVRNPPSGLLLPGQG